MTDKSIVGQRIKELRLKAGRTQRDFGEMVGISSASVMNYEKGVKLPPLDTVIKIAETFGASIDWLCGIEMVAINKKTLTYADIVREIITIADMLKMTVTYESDSKGEEKDTIQFLLKDGFFVWILSDWIKMRNLHSEHVIDDKLYKTWIEGACAPIENFAFNGDGEQRFADSVLQVIEDLKNDKKSQ